MHKRLMILIFGILLINFISAVPPVTTTQQFASGYILDAPFRENFEIGENYTFILHVMNISNGLRVSENIKCDLHFFDINGSELFYIDGIAVDHAFQFDIDGNNYTNAGLYSYSFHCNNTYLGGYHSGFVWMTESGIDITNERATLIIGSLAILVLLFFISLFALFKVENYIGKFVLYWISHVFFILITFIGWQIGVEGILGGFALTGIFRIMFWFSILSVLPMVILSGAWIFYIHAFNEHFQKLLDKGEDTETAFKMTNKKRGGGWFAGK